MSCVIIEINWIIITSLISTTKITLTINSKKAYKNEDEIELDVPAIIINNRTLVPVKFIAESLGNKVEWDENTKSVNIISLTYLNSKLPTSNNISKNVFVLNFDPVVKATNNKLHLACGFNDPNVLANKYISALKESSNNQVDSMKV